MDNELEEIMERIDKFFEKNSVHLESRYFITKQMNDDYWQQIQDQGDAADVEDDDDFEDEEPEEPEEDLDVPEPPKPKSTSGHLKKMSAKLNNPAAKIRKEDKERI